MKTKKQLKKIIEDLFGQENYEPVKLAYLFGSRAEELKGLRSENPAVGELSDYDFGIFTPYEYRDDENISTKKRFKLESKLSRILDEDIDIVLLNKAPIELQYNVITFGILLYESELKDRVEYESRVLGRYGDYLPVLRDQKKDIIQGGSNEARVQRYRKALRKTEQMLEQARATEG